MAAIRVSVPECPHILGSFNVIIMFVTKILLRHIITRAIESRVCSRTGHRRLDKLPYVPFQFNGHHSKINIIILDPDRSTQLSLGIGNHLHGSLTKC